jgi:hypothetical protein
MNAFAGFFRQIMLGVLVTVLCSQAMADFSVKDEQLFAKHYPANGFFVLAEDRFEPWVQRMMAERSLKSLPLSSGRLYYVYPISLDPRIEEMQIRYMEELLEKAQAEGDREEQSQESLID